MSTTNECTHASCWARRVSLIAAVLGASLMIGPKWSSADATPVTKARRFPSAASGSPALFEAVQDGHQYAMHKILGADDLASCGDDTRDRREIMFRRIGADEATAVEVCRAAVEAARRNVTRTGGTDPVARYAEALVDAARASGGPAHRATPDDEPFYGYRFIVLDNGGITVVAYPAEY